MKVFVAGATGAIGRPLIAELIRQGHAVTGMTRSGLHGLKELGAAVAQVDAFDPAAVEDALRKSGAEAVIDQLTSLPKSPADMAAARANDRRLRLEGGGNLRRAALACGVRRYVQQSSGFFLAPGEGLADESVGLAVDASAGVASHARSHRLSGRGRALEVLLGADDSDGDLAEHYGYVYRSLPDAELDKCVDALATRIASFDKQAIAETKRFENARAQSAPRRRPCKVREAAMPNEPAAGAERQRQ